MLGLLLSDEGRSGRGVEAVAVLADIGGEDRLAPLSLGIWPNFGKSASLLAARDRGTA
jgi:hypothetical protein